MNRVSIGELIHAGYARVLTPVRLCFLAGRFRPHPVGLLAHRHPFYPVPQGRRPADRFPSRPLGLTAATSGIRQSAE
jgi:hypothetical protein